MARTKSTALSQGVLMFAFNNERTDYLAMAAWSAGNIRRHLGLPVAVVTNDPVRAATLGFEHVIASESDTGGTRYFADYDATVTWHNAGRVNAYELSPFEQTLVLDADYVVCSKQLELVLDMPQQFAAFQEVWNAEDQFSQRIETFGQHRIPMWWATVMMFRRGSVSQYIFDTMTMIRQNWQHYRDLYHVHQSNYRNDIALSIALGLVAGAEQSVHAIPYPLMNVQPTSSLHQLELDYYEILYKNSHNRMLSFSYRGIDFHAMGKGHLETIIAASR